MPHDAPAAPISAPAAPLTTPRAAQAQEAAPVIAPDIAPVHWLMLLAAAGLYSGAFAFIELGLTTAPASAIVMGRLWIGALVVWGWMRYRGRRLPPLIEGRALNPAWIWFSALGVIGATLPFTLISLGQRDVDSAVAGILMAVMPLTTIALAHVFVPGERLTARKLTGFIIGFVGVAILMGPSALRDLGGPQSLAQFIILIAATAYAVNAILARRAPDFPASTTAAGLLLAAAIASTPLGVWSLIEDTGGISLASTFAIVVLGVGSTGVATILIMQLVRTAGPSFLAIINYIIPVTATFIGVALGESLGLNVFASLGVILLGVAIATWRRGGQRA